MDVGDHVNPRTVVPPGGVDRPAALGWAALGCALAVLGVGVAARGGIRASYVDEFGNPATVEGIVDTHFVTFFGVPGFVALLGAAVWLLGGGRWGRLLALTGFAAFVLQRLPWLGGAWSLGDPGYPWPWGTWAYWASVGGFVAVAAGVWLAARQRRGLAGAALGRFLLVVLAGLLLAVPVAAVLLWFGGLAATR